MARFEDCLETAFNYTTEFGAWIDVTHLLVDEVNPWFEMPCLFLRWICWAVCTIIQGVFINETFRAAEKDDEILKRRTMRDNLSDWQKMKHFFHRADRNDDTLTLEEFIDMMGTDDAKAQLVQMGVEVDDPKTAWQLLGRPETLQQLSDGIAKIKGGAKAMDVFTLTQDVRQLTNEIANRETFSI